MKIRTITRMVGTLATAIESKARRGRVVVLAIQCTGCGRWVNPNGWNPRHALCETCTAHATTVQLGRTARRWRATSPSRWVRG